MKKILLLLAAALGLSASAQKTFSGSTLYGYCVNPVLPVTISAGNTLGAAMQLNAATIKQFNGCKITAIAIANGNALDASVTTLPIDLFVGETMNTDPSQTFSGEMDLSAPLAYKEYTLPEPIVISASTPELYFGYTVVCEPTKYNPLVTDATVDENAGPGDFIGMLTTGGQWQWAQQRSSVGMPCLRLKIEGENLPANNVAIIEQHLPTFAVPGSDATAGIYVYNAACNTVESLTVSYTINGSEPQTLTVALPAPLLNNEHSDALTFKLPMPDVEGNDLPVSVEITGINADAEANNAAASQRTASTTYLSLSQGYDRAVVVEEATATWCGFCPRGLVGMKAMAEAHADDGRFIPIAVHFRDRLTVQSYDQFFGEDYTGGTTPSCLVNRNRETFGAQDPSLEFLQAAYAEQAAQPAICSVDIKSITFDAEKKTVGVEAEAEFALDVNGEYGFSYVLTEDNVGPYDQANYFAPAEGRGMKLEWWDQRPNPVKNIYYDHIARYIYPFKGLKNSIPAEVVASTKYAHKASLQTNTVTDINNCRVVVMVMNRKSGRIENAVSAKYADFASINEVKSVSAEVDGPVYDLLGRRVSNPTRGLYIRNGKKVFNL